VDDGRERECRRRLVGALTRCELASEIVIALRVPPEDARGLYHRWLWAGERGMRRVGVRKYCLSVPPSETI
jgi:hypothetical protein